MRSASAIPQSAVTPRRGSRRNLSTRPERVRLLRPPYVHPARSGTVSLTVTEVSEPSEFQVDVEVCALSATEGGRTTPLIDGYHPLCRFSNTDGEHTLVGLAALRLATPVQPGDCGTGLLVFGAAAASVARNMISSYSKFEFVEGAQVVASVRVRGADMSGTATGG